VWGFSLDVLRVLCVRWEEYRIPEGMTRGRERRRKGR